MESYDKLLERYRSNNCELALALNDMKIELDAVNRKLLAKENDLQTVYAENASLKKELAQRDNQLNTWRMAFVDLVQTNTRKCTEVMQQIGLVPTANSINKPNTVSVQQSSNSTKTEVSTTPLTTQNLAIDSRVNALRRRRFSLDDSPSHRLANLTEENSQINDSSSLTPTSPITKCHVTARRRVSIPPVSPVSSPPKKLKDKKPIEKKTDSKPMIKIPEIGDENTPQNTNGRPSRRTTAPKNLAEPKLRTKLRRN